MWEGRFCPGHETMALLSRCRDEINTYKQGNQPHEEIILVAGGGRPCATLDFEGHKKASEVWIFRNKGWTVSRGEPSLRGEKPAKDSGLQCRAGHSCPERSRGQRLRGPWLGRCDGTCRGELDPHPSTEGAKRSMGVGVCLKTNTKHSKTRGIQHT